MKKASSGSRRSVVAAERPTDARRVDGNAAAGILSEVFVSDLTAARARCAGRHVHRHGGRALMHSGFSSST